MGDKRNAYRILVGTPEGKRSLENPRRTWENNIKMDVIEIGWGGIDWIHLADRDQWKASPTMALGSIQSLTEMSTRNLPGGKGRPARRDDSLTAVCEPIV
jgi:hypothetical protein